MPQYAIELELMLLIEAGKLAAECEDDAIRTALPIAFDAHLARGEHDRYAQLLVAMTCACPWWLPRNNPRRGHESGLRAGQRPQLHGVRDPGLAVVYFERFSKGSGVSEPELINESV
ncbi:hypothetical protein [Streptomyces sp. NL15-2K]|uniref:hypothetical protein n=1 Tax=Streptomyces sp. NL15-2K TaxID=376149 RepID=UPI000F587081|nr:MULTISPECIES: hypothetical protein [Actinomycetes]WKX15804.1 hypothetical protein Q4V64_53245 [Kutzneria buriramensis]